MSQLFAPYKMDEMLYLNHVEEYGMPNTPLYRRIQTRLGCIDTATEVAELHVQLLLRGIAATIDAAECHNRFSSLQPIARIEIFGDWYTNAAQNTLCDRGLVLFDLNTRPMIHITEAHIGYEGSGPGLTEAILGELGVERAIFDEIQASYAGIVSTDTPYNVVVQRVSYDNGLFRWHWSSVR